MFYFQNFEILLNYDLFVKRFLSKPENILKFFIRNNPIPTPSTPLRTRLTLPLKGREFLAPFFFLLASDFYFLTSYFLLLTSAYSLLFYFICFYRFQVCLTVRRKSCASRNKSSHNNIFFKPKQFIHLAAYSSLCQNPCSLLE